MKIIIQTIKDKTVFKMKDDYKNNHALKKDVELSFRSGSAIKIYEDLKTFLINPANIVWIEISEEQRD